MFQIYHLPGTNLPKQGQVTTLYMAFTYKRKPLKKSNEFLKYARAYLRKRRYASECHLFLLQTKVLRTLLLFVDSTLHFITFVAELRMVMVTLSLKTAIWGVT